MARAKADVVAQPVRLLLRQIHVGDDPTARKLQSHMPDLAPATHHRRLNALVDSVNSAVSAEPRVHRSVERTHDVPSGVTHIGLTLLLSTMLQSQILAGIASIVLLFALPIVQLSTGDAGNYTSFGVVVHADTLLMGGSAPAALAGCAGLIVATLAGSVAVLRRAEFG